MGSVKILNHLFAVSDFIQFMCIDHLALHQRKENILFDYMYTAHSALNAYDRTTQNINHTSVDQTWNERGHRIGMMQIANVDFAMKHSLWFLYFPR